MAAREPAESVCSTESHLPLARVVRSAYERTATRSPVDKEVERLR